MNWSEEFHRGEPDEKAVRKMLRFLLQQPQGRLHKRPGSLVKWRFFANNRLGLVFFSHLCAFGCWVPRPHLSAIPFTLVHELGSLPPERQIPYSMLVRH